jgi:hypothetical protein
VLERPVASIRDRAATRLWQRLAQLPNTDQQAKLAALVQVPDGAQSSPLDQLRRAPTRVSGPALVAAWQRLEDIRATGVSEISVAHLPPNRLRDLARYAAAARAQAIARMPPERRLATLLAFAHAFEVIALDDALDLLDLVITDIIHDAQTEGEHQRLRTLRDLDAAALQLWEAIQVLLDERIDDAAVRRRTFLQMPVSDWSRPAPRWRPSPAHLTTTITRNSSSAIAVSGSFYPPSYARSRLTAHRLDNPCSRRWPFSCSSNINATRTCIMPRLTSSLGLGAVWSSHSARW